MQPVRDGHMAMKLILVIYGEFNCTIHSTGTHWIVTLDGGGNLMSGLEQVVVANRLLWLAIGSMILFLRLYICWMRLLQVTAKPI